MVEEGITSDTVKAEPSRSPEKNPTWNGQQISVKTAGQSDRMSNCDRGRSGCGQMRRTQPERNLALKWTQSILWCLLLAIATGFCPRSAWALGEEPKSGETIT